MANTNATGLEIVFGKTQAQMVALVMAASRDGVLEPLSSGSSGDTGGGIWGIFE